MNQKAERIALCQMQQAAADMVYMDELYRAFRRIRHDFANYLQCSNFESEGEDFILRLRVLKKETLQLVDELLEKMPEIEEKSRRADFSWLKEPIALKRNSNERTRVLLKIWEEMKGYFECQLQEVFRITPVLLHLQDRLQRSLPPDERESREHLAECDSICCHMTAENVLLAAYVYTFQKEAESIGVTFRFQLSVPTRFHDRLGDFFYLLGISKAAAIAALSGYDRTGDKHHDAGVIRIRMAEGMGLWHFFLEYGRMREDDELMLRGDFENDRYLKKILKRMDAVLSEKENDRKVQVDITG